jgi:hypothetical protein
MANNFEATQYITEYALAQFVNNTQFTRMSSRKFEKMFTNEKYATGQTINVRLTNNFGVQYGPSTTPQGVLDRFAPLTIEQQIQNSLSFTSEELTLNLKTAPRLDIMDMYIKPMVISISNAADLYQIDKLLTINSYVGVPGTIVNSIDIVNNAAANLTARGVPVGDRYCGVDIQTGASIKNSMKANFTPNINEGVVKTGFIADIYGIEFFETQNLSYHTSGTGDGTAPVAGKIGFGTVLNPVASGNSIIITGLPVSTTGVALAGDIIELQVTQAVNKVTGQSTGILMSFSVLADVDSNGLGNAEVFVNPSVISDVTSPYRNVSGVIGAGQSVKLLASHRIGYLLHKDALQSALPMMKNLGAGTETSYARYDTEHSLAMRYTQGSVVLDDVNVHRLDILIGALCLSDYGVRIVG